MTESYFDESQDDLTLEEDREEREYRLRYERRQRMRQERQRRMRRRQMMQRTLLLVIVGVITVLIVATVKHGKKAEEEGAQDQAVEAVEQPDQLEIEKIRESIMEEENAGKSETEEMEADKTETEKEIPVFRFEETEDTAYIDSADVISTNAILVDESSDQIVAAKGARERIMPASMTKVLTILVAAEHISEEELDDTFTMTREITDYAYVNDCSSVGFLDEEKVPVRDLFYGTAMHSGGDAALGLAFYVAGSQEAFVDLMNEKLEELGLSESAHFTNCVGVYDDDHYCTPYDMAVIMGAALENDLCRQVLSAKTYTTSETEEHPEGMILSNWFLRRIEDKDVGDNVKSGKTGYVEESGSCAVSYGENKDGKRYICVTADAQNQWRCIDDHAEIYRQVM